MTWRCQSSRSSKPSRDGVAARTDLWVWTVLKYVMLSHTVWMYWDTPFLSVFQQFHSCYPSIPTSRIKNPCFFYQWASTLNESEHDMFQAPVLSARRGSRNPCSWTSSVRAIFAPRRWPWLMAWLLGSNGIGPAGIVLVKKTEAQSGCILILMVK